MDFDRGEITVPLRAAQLWIKDMEKSNTLNEYRDKFLNTPRKDLSEKDYSSAEEPYTKYTSASGTNFVEGSELRREKDSLPLVESLKNR
ncbi:hypothetical protein BGAL_0393g00080 [Botrytis galanthina]|uniref:Uncharacterized protein n=1 Tax=Botrytis galanthina TaxID=278940 RepID=A0A4S8QSK2_9HELO|nr:hypothetical protein BGAL_0393g00080 [Botrytis galanthina]